MFLTLPFRRRPFPWTTRRPLPTRGLARRFCPRVETFESRWAPATLTVLNLNDSGAGSLRQAILDSNSQAGDDTIIFAAGVGGAIDLATALPDLSTNTDLEGPGANVLTAAL